MSSKTQEDDRDAILKELHQGGDQQSASGSDEDDEDLDLGLDKV